MNTPFNPKHHRGGTSHLTFPKETDMDIDRPMSPITRRRSGESFHGKQPVMNWGRIQRGTEIALIQDFQRIASGWVDDVMPDGSGLWLIQKDDGERRFFLKVDGITAVRLQGKPCSGLPFPKP